MPRSLSSDVIREAPLLRTDASIEDALRTLLDAELPALPVVDDRDRLVGIFGEREFFSALFPGYVGQLKYAGFLTSSIDEALERRSCTREQVGKHMNTEHVDVAEDASDVQIAETFLHHRVLILPVTRDGRVTGVITRRAFFRRLAQHALDR